MAPIPNPSSWKGRLATELRTGRDRRGLTRQEVAAKVGTSIGTIQRAESGRDLPTLETARAIAAVCHLDEEGIESFWRKASQRGRQLPLTRARPLRQIVDAAELGVALRHCPADHVTFRPVARWLGHGPGGSDESRVVV
ncbi:helix-turn-helix transcriptional regulator, partial [Streptomyces sp. NPDC055642]